MQRNLRFAVVLLPLMAVVLLGAGCGGGSDKASSNDTSDTTAADTAADGDSSGDTNAAQSSSDDSGSGGKGAGIPKIADGTYKEGTATVEVSGEDEANFDSLTIGQTDGGVTLLSFMGAGGNLTIGFGPGADDSSVSAGLAGLSVGGSFGKECGVQFSKNDSSGLAGEFTCTKAPAVDSGSGKLGERDLKGTFSVER